MSKKTIHKWFWVWDFEKEEAWLNTMAQSGWLLDKVGFCSFDFIECTPGEYTIRLEMHDHDEAYISFMQETGAEYIGRMVKWIYFRKRTQDGVFDIFSDIDSRITHLDHIGKMLSIVATANLLIGLANSINPSISLGWINLMCATLLMYGLGRIHEKKEALEKERMLRE